MHQGEERIEHGYAQVSKAKGVFVKEFKANFAQLVLDPNAQEGYYSTERRMVFIKE
jgi:hypothetical protein